MVEREGFVHLFVTDLQKAAMQEEKKRRHAVAGELKNVQSSNHFFSNSWHRFTWNTYIYSIAHLS